MVAKKILSHIADVSLGQTFRERAETDSPESGVRLIQIKDVREGELNDINSLPYADIEPSKLKVKLLVGDLLLPLRGMRTEAMVFRGESGNVTTTNQVAIIRPRQDGGVSLEYLHWFFNSAKGSVLLESIRTSASIPNISVKNLLEISVPVPSPKKQKQIVDIYHNWCAQRDTLRELIVNGENMVASAAHEILGGD